MLGPETLVMALLSEWVTSSLDVGFNFLVLKELHNILASADYIWAKKKKFSQIISCVFNLVVRTVFERRVYKMLNVEATKYAILSISNINIINIKITYF